MKSGFLCITHVNIFSCSEDSVPPVEEDLPDGLGFPMADLRQLRSRKTLQSTGLRAICGQICRAAAGGTEKEAGLPGKTGLSKRRRQQGLLTRKRPGRGNRRCAAGSMVLPEAGACPRKNFSPSASHPFSEHARPPPGQDYGTVYGIPGDRRAGATGLPGPKKPVTPAGSGPEEWKGEAFIGGLPSRGLLA